MIRLFLLNQTKILWFSPLCLDGWNNVCTCYPFTSRTIFFDTNLKRNTTTPLLIRDCYTQWLVLHQWCRSSIQKAFLLLPSTSSAVTAISRISLMIVARNAELTPSETSTLPSTTKSPTEPTSIKPSLIPSSATRDTYYNTLARQHSRPTTLSSLSFGTVSKLLDDANAG